MRNFRFISIRSLAIIFLLSLSHGFGAHGEPDKTTCLILKLSGAACDEKAEEAGDVIKTFMVTPDLKILNHTDTDFLISDGQTQETISKKDLKSIGMAIDNASSVTDISTERCPGWAVYSTDGKLLYSGADGNPCYDRLKKGGIFIIRHNNRTYKYIPLN